MQFWKRGAGLKANTIRFAMINRSRLFREGMKRALQSFGDYDLVQEAATPSEFCVSKSVRGEPVLVIMALQSYETDEHLRLKPFSAIHPDAVFLITYWNIDNNKVVEMVRNGARGFCKATDEPRVFHHAIQDVLKGGYHFNHVLTARTLREADKR